MKSSVVCGVVVVELIERFTDLSLGCLDACMSSCHISLLRVE